MITFKMPLVIKFNENGFYTSSSYEPNFKTTFLVDDYPASCIINLYDNTNKAIYFNRLEHILHSKYLVLNETIDPDDFWELGK